MIISKPFKILLIPFAAIAVLIAGCSGTAPTSALPATQGVSTNIQLDSEAAALRQAPFSLNTLSSNPSATPTPIPVTYGHIIGLDDTFSPTDGDTLAGGNGNTIDGVPCDNSPIPYHIHAHVSLFVNGQRLAIPDAIGLHNPNAENKGMTFATICYYHLHSHDATGLIHIEAPTKTSFTLGQLFAVWGQQLSSTNVAGKAGRVQAFVATAKSPGWAQQTGTYTSYQGDLQQLPLASHEEVVLEVGPTFIYPPNLPAIIFPTYQ